MKKIKQLTAAVLALVMVLALAPASLAANAPGFGNFQKVSTYTDGTFTDVPAGEWYAADVKTAYELGLVNGSYGQYAPNDNVRVSAALVLACRMHSIYNTGKADFVQGDPWYQVYVDYAVANGIIAAGQFTDYNAYITRRDFAGIMAKALPADALTAINTVENGAIPDVAAGSANYDAIYTLYRAGVLTGNDAYGTFTPDTYIARSGVAALVARMTNPQLRKSVSLQAATVTMYTIDGTSEEVPVSAIAHYQSYGWYLFPDYVCATADLYFSQGDYATAADVLEVTMFVTDENTAEYNKYYEKFAAILNTWYQANNGCPIAIVADEITYDSFGNPELNTTYRNLTPWDILTFEDQWTCVDAYGNITTDYPYLYNGTVSSSSSAGDVLYGYTSAVYTTTLYDNSRTTSVTNHHMVRVAFVDGGVWE
ncbi:MAG: hypothetical protein HFF18_13885 [Oscillospiraceae bacterium]|nr:hypothetical protein [Oscillospiraceae bacterium]